MNNNPVTVLLCVLALVALVAVGGWVAGSRIESPAEVAARTAPPRPSPILVPVESRVLSTNVVTRGTARFGLPQPISIAPSTVKANTAGLITTLPARNTQVKEGDVLFTASGRPVMVLEGDQPAYRDLVPGISGSDVRQLEQGLERLGFDPGPIDGTYDEKTSAAVGEWYESRGYEPFWPTVEQLANIRLLEQGLADAKKLQMAAASAAAAADLAVETARMKAVHTDKLANADIQAGIAARALVVLDPRGLATSRAAADAKIEVGRAALRAARTEGELNYQAALDAKEVAEFDAKLAATRVDHLATDLEMAQRKLGVQVPVDELVFVPALPVRIHEVTAVVGSPASGPLLSVTDNQITIDSSLALEAAPLVKPGMEVHIEESAFGIKTKGVVERVESTPGTHGVDGYHIYFAVHVDESPIPLEGFSLRLTIPLESSQAAVIAVPLSAISLTADGISRIQVEKDGLFESIEVRPGLSADGYVQVTPVEATLEPGQRVVIGSANNGDVDSLP